MKKSDFYFELPESLIAQTPIPHRSDARLMVVEKKTGRFFHRNFCDIVDYIKPGDCLVINDTKVIPARLMGIRTDTGAKIEILLLNRKSDGVWEVLVKPGKKAKTGAQIHFADGLLKAVIMEVLPNGNRLIGFQYEGIFENILDQLGEMPLPPYIQSKLEDKERYQTVYAQHWGSAAAPTAGLHFTESLLSALSQQGIAIAKITLHVGLGTFRPVKTEDIAEHQMHQEYYHVEPEQADIINDCRKSGGSIVAVGTTSCRTLEACTDKHGNIQPGSGHTDIFITPGYEFKMVDRLITNFHLPESTLIMLVSALSSRTHILQAYEAAVKAQYRFFSFGDAMMII